MNPLFKAAFEYIGFLSSGIKAAVPEQITNVKPKTAGAIGCDTEVVPAAVANSVAVDPQKKIILEVVYPHGYVQISALKIAIKYKRL